MKKVFLLLAGGAFAMTATAQQAKSVVLKNREGRDNAVGHAAAHSQPMSAGIMSTPSLTGAKTTAGPGGTRWYSYVDEVLGTNTAVAHVTKYRGFYIWQDTTALFGYTPSGGSPTYINNEFLSVGLGFDPFVAAYNDVTLEGNGLIKITSTDNYTIDSVLVFGSYERSSDPTKTTVVDTMVVGVTYGNGSLTSNMPADYFTGMMSDYGVDTVRFLDVLHDTAKNTIAKNPSASAPAPIIVRVPLTATDSAVFFFCSCSSINVGTCW